MNQRITEKRKKEKRTHTKVPLLGKLLLLLPVTCIVFYPVYLANQLDLVESVIYSERLPAAFDGLTIAYLSDIHYGPYFSSERVQALIQKVNALGADIIALGGDYGKDSLGALEFFQMMPEFKAKLCTVAVMGNHDRTVPDSRMHDIMAAMQNAGVTPLVNDALYIKKGGETLALAAPDDFYNGFPSMSAVRESVRDADYVVFLPHSPDFLANIDDFFFDLALCGHTHGGQITLFGHALHSPCLSGDRYLTGWKKEKGADILISNGVGTSFLPVRLGARPQYHLITLRSGAPI